MLSSRMIEKMRTLQEIEKTLRPSHRLPSKEYVYFIQIKDFIKIGRTKDINYRIREVQKQYFSISRNQKVIGVLFTDNSTETEKNIHKKFLHLRASRELFLKSVEILDHLGEIMSNEEKLWTIYFNAVAKTHLNYPTNDVKTPAIDPRFLTYLDMDLSKIKNPEFVFSHLLICSKTILATRYLLDAQQRVLNDKMNNLYLHVMRKRVLNGGE
jgi:hypothetical protein